jgi:hypothetical protein
VAENGFGGNLKFELSEARLLTIAGDWVGDDVTQLGEGSIYRRLLRWPVNRTRRAAVGGRRRYWRKR